MADGRRGSSAQSDELSAPTSFVGYCRSKGLPKVASIQNVYSLINRSAFETDLAEVCAPKNCNVGLLAYSPLSGGALSGKYVDGTAPKGARFTLFKVCRLLERQTL